MSIDVDSAVAGVPDTEPGTERTIHVALGRRVEVIGDLLLPPEPTDSSRAGCRDIARRLEEWQGPGIVVLCGHLVAAGLPGVGRPRRRAGRPPRTDRRPARVRGAEPTRRWSSSWRRRSGIPPWSAPSRSAGSTCGTRSTWPARRAPAPAPCSCAPAPSDPTPPRRWTPHRPRTGRGWPAWNGSTTRRRPGASSPRGCSTAGCGVSCGRHHSSWPASRCCCGSTS